MIRTSTRFSGLQRAQPVSEHTYYSGARGDSVGRSAVLLVLVGLILIFVFVFWVGGVAKRAVLGRQFVFCFLFLFHSSDRNVLVAVLMEGRQREQRGLGQQVHPKCTVRF